MVDKRFHNMYYHTDRRRTPAGIRGCNRANGGTIQGRIRYMGARGVDAEHDAVPILVDAGPLISAKTTVADAYVVPRCRYHAPRIRILYSSWLANFGHDPDVYGVEGADAIRTRLRPALRCTRSACRLNVPTPSDQQSFISFHTNALDNYV